MTLVADEGVDAAIVMALRAAGHTVVYVAEMDPGVDDERVLALAGRHQALLITGTRTLESWYFVCVGRTPASCSCASKVCRPSRRRDA